MASKTEAIAPKDVEADTTIAYKIGGRWYWVTEVLSDTGNFIEVMTVPVAKDPRYAQVKSLHGGRGAKARLIWKRESVLMRAQTAPVFEWVTKKLQRYEAAHCDHHLEFRSDCRSCCTEREFTN